MLDVSTTPGEALVELSLDEAAFPRDAVYAAGFAMIDRCWVHLDRAAGKLKIALKAKSAGADLAALASEITDELHAEAWRLRVIADNRAIIDNVAKKAFGGAAAEPAALDALLADGAADEGAFEDPLGIALSWEEKYGKKPDDAGGAA